MPSASIKTGKMSKTSEPYFLMDSTKNHDNLMITKIKADS